MRRLYIDCRSGLSGDMMLGAFLDLGVPLEVLEKGLEVLGVDEFHLEVKKSTTEDGKTVTDVDVVLEDGETPS